MKTLFWTLILLIFYCYFGYPLLLSLIAKVGSRKVAKGNITPSVSVVMSVWNEEDVIEEKIKNILALDYPMDKLEIIVGSDGSIDDTDKIIESFNDNRITLVSSSIRRGKMITLNEIVSKAQNEIVVFTDARQNFSKDAILKLVGNFSDPKVGCVSGELEFSEKEGGTAKGINLYWSYEKFLRDQESKIHSMLGATGAVYAIRRELFVEIPENVVLDDVFIPLKIIEKGYRAIFDNTAKAYDEVADSPREEHRRKARTLFGNYQIFNIMKGMFNPFKSPIAIQFFSHKLLRVIVPFFMIATFLINAVLLQESLYRTLFVLQVVFYAMALLGCLARHQKYGILRIVLTLCYVPYVFCLLNFSALIGFFRFVGSKQGIAWEKARSQN